MMGRTRASTAMVVCPVCNQSFTRREHLRRHERSHTLDKPYQCSLCNKHFARLDVLNRHCASHNQERTGSVYSRACKRCANDRVRCSRGQPCKRCMDRKSVCWYPPARRAPHRTSADEIVEMPPQDERDNDNFLRQFPDDLHSQVPSNATECTSHTAFPPDMSSVSDDATGWTSGICNDAGRSAFGQPDLSAFGVNWISPQYENNIDWDAIVAGISINTRIDSNQGEPWESEGGTSVHEGCYIHPQYLPLQRQKEVEQVSVRSETAHRDYTITASLGTSSTKNLYYVDGDGARAPFGGRVRRRGSAVASEELRDELGGVTTASLASSTGISTSLHILSKAAYDNLVCHMSMEHQQHDFTISFSSFPSLSEMQLFVSRYFENFHPIFPFVCKSTWPDVVSSEWLLLLAVAAVGSRYMHRGQDRNSRDMLATSLDAALGSRKYGFGLEHALSHDDLFVPGASAKSDICPNIATLQASILNILLLQHSGKKTLVDRALVERHYLVEACELLGLVSSKPATAHIRDAPGHTSQDATRQWLERETEIRTGLMIWYLDCIFIFEFKAKPLMDLDQIKCLLPSQDDIWDSLELEKSVKISTSSLTLLDAMEMMYMEKKLPPHLGEFSAAILVNAVYRHTHNVLRVERYPLNSWTPSAVAQRIANDESFENQRGWLPMSSTSLKWRNSACDCLDILHWPANSKVARLSGSEHHMILHLHLARLIILTPTECLRTLSATIVTTYRASKDTGASKVSAAARHQILQWVIQDRCKARLSIIHCGALYWHIGRYSRNSIIEPYAIYMATLILWAFCTSMQLPDVIEAISQDSVPDPEPGFLHLDRPIDDELVQTFVRAGHKMSAYMSRIGNILEPGASAKILEEGISLLTGRPRVATSHGSSADFIRTSQDHEDYTWGIEESYVVLLQELLLATSEANNQPSRATGL